MGWLERRGRLRERAHRCVHGSHYDERVARLQDLDYLLQEDHLQQRTPGLVGQVYRHSTALKGYKVL